LYSSSTEIHVPTTLEADVIWFGRSARGAVCADFLVEVKYINVSRKFAYAVND
jgi:hypothetical protein